MNLKATALRYAKQLDSSASLRRVKCNVQGDNFSQYTCATRHFVLDICFRTDETPSWFNVDMRNGVKIKIHGNLDDWSSIFNINLSH